MLRRYAQLMTVTWKPTRAEFGVSRREGIYPVTTYRKNKKKRRARHSREIYLKVSIKKAKSVKLFVSCLDPVFKTHEGTMYEARAK